MIVLHKMIRQAQSFELVLPERLHEKPATVLKNVGNQNCNVSEGSGLNLNFHDRLGDLSRDLWSCTLEDLPGGNVEPCPDCVCCTYRSSTRSTGLISSSGSSPCSTSLTKSMRQCQLNSARSNSSFFLPASVGRINLRHSYAPRRTREDN